MVRQCIRYGVCFMYIGAGFYWEYVSKLYIVMYLLMLTHSVISRVVAQYHK